jgi:hypothetical protein
VDYFSGTVEVYMGSIQQHRKRPVRFNRKTLQGRGVPKSDQSRQLPYVKAAMGRLRGRPLKRPLSFAAGSAAKYSLCSGLVGLP